MRGTLIADLLVNFWSRVDTSGECWRWMGETATNGYGRFYTGRSKVSAHRFAWELANRMPLETTDACHSCDNRWCVNPDHVFPGSRGDNMRDALAKGRLRFQSDPSVIPRGEHSGRSRLTEEQVREVLASDFSGGRLAAKFGCDPSTIHRIRSGEAWGHIRALASAAQEGE